MSTPSGFTPHALDEDCLESYRYLLTVPGKGVRSRLIDAFQQWLCVPDEIIGKIKEIVQMLHNASLMVDDIEDNSNLRRGIPCAHLIYGIPMTINTANYAYFMALEKVHELNNPLAMSVFVSELLNLHRGQGQDIRWRERGECPSEEAYKSMVLDKTGGLFRLAVLLMQAFSENKADFVPLVDKLALYFQIRDDFINLASSAYMKKKSFCEDLTEGKFSFPIIHSIRTAAAAASQEGAAMRGDNRLLNILKQRTSDERIKRYALRLMRGTQSFRYTRAALLDLHRDVELALEALGGHKHLAALLSKLQEQVVGLDIAEEGSASAGEDATEETLVRESLAAAAAAEAASSSSGGGSGSPRMRPRGGS